jgi:hypothetical protein
MRSALLPLATGVSLLLGTGLTAQTLPLPVLPPAPAPGPVAPPEPAPTPKAPGQEPAAQPAVDTGPQRARPWEYEVGMGVGWDSNAAFLLPDGQSSTAIVPGGRIARVLSSTKGQLRAEAAGRWAGYPSQDTLNRSYFDAGLRGDYRSSARTQWRGDVHYWLGYTDSSPTLVEQGVPLPLGKSSTLFGEFALSHKLGTQTSVRAEGRFQGIDFDDPAFIDGRSLRGTVALGRQLRVRDSAAAAYALEGVLAAEEGGSYLTHYGSLQWTHTLSPRSALLLEAGASYTPDASQVGLSRSQGFFGGVTFLRQIGRSSLTAYLRREVAPAFGLGVSRLENRAGLRAEAPLGRDWTLTAAAYHTQPDSPEGAEQPYYASNSDASAALDRRVGRHLTVSGEARYRRRGETVAQPAVSAFQIGLFVALGTPRE